MKYFLTGATGFIGLELTKRLLSEGHTVHALYRSEEKANRLPVGKIRRFKGDLFKPDVLAEAMLGCDGAFHLAGLARPWHSKPQTFYQINVEGARNVFRAAEQTGIEKVVFTSTAGLINPSGSQASNEDSPRTVPLSTDYEKSKEAAEQVALEFANKQLDVVIVNPSRVYGPGVISESNGVTKMIDLYLKGKFRWLPGNGQSIGNYAFIEDVVDGHIRAMAFGKTGERYILGGTNASFQVFFDCLAEVSGCKRSMIKFPVPLMLAVAGIMEYWANLTGFAPLITPPWVRKYAYHWKLSTKKAEEELGYQPSSLSDGLEKTIKWLRQRK